MDLLARVCARRNIMRSLVRIVRDVIGLAPTACRLMVTMVVITDLARLGPFVRNNTMRSLAATPSAASGREFTARLLLQALARTTLPLSRFLGKVSNCGLEFQ